ncbi:succinate--CoA ligase subunit beta [Candidatus Woesearchaeota archaeon]|nr:MAG: succinate--CoA ligase subunit beta [Candidatus Woesearchaeota archaeon]
MNLKEYQAKRIFDQYDITIPRGVLIREDDDDVDLQFIQSETCLVKAQIPLGKRKKHGGILECEKNHCVTLAKELLHKTIEGHPVKEALIEEKCPNNKEYYVALTIDPLRRQYTLILSEQGGIDIEELAQQNPQAIVRISLDTFSYQNIRDNHKKQLEHYPQEIFLIIRKLFNVMRDCDATLVEINPLIDTGDGLVAADAKIVIDDNALYRHKHLAQYKYEGLSTIEKLAESSGLHYVDLQGDIGVIGNGAGLVMATIDILKDKGGEPANFLDLRGGTGVETMEVALETLTKKSLKGIIINIFAGITHCDDIAQGIIQFKKHHELAIPIAVRMIGTKEQEGKEILEKHGIKAFRHMEDAIEMIVNQTR